MYKNEEKKKEKQIVLEEKNGGFKCCYCKQWVLFSEFMGTAHRNHCSFCLWSKHVDTRPGDRKAECGSRMKPIGLTFKKEGVDRYGQERQGELMLIHECFGCGKISINRIAADDDSEVIVEILNKSKELSLEKIAELEKNDIKVLTKKEKSEVIIQLFGKNPKKNSAC